MAFSKSEREKQRIFRENLRNQVAEKTLTEKNFREYIVNKVLPDYFGIDVNMICGKADKISYKDDLCMDSMDMVELEILIDDDFKINSFRMTGEENRILNNRTVNDTAAVLYKTLINK